MVLVMFKKIKRKKTPLYLQMEMLECGAAALGIILAYYQCYVPLEQLRMDCGVSRDGSKAEHIIQAAKKYGLKASGYQVSPSELQNVPTPFIAFWRYNHFLVVEGFTQSTVFINDPQSGHQTLTLETFLNEYSGVVITLSPTKKFKKSGVAPNIFYQLLKKLTAHSSSLFFLFIAGFALTLLGLATPIFSKIFVDEYLVNKIPSSMQILIIGISLTLFLKFGLNFIQKFYLNRLENKITILSSQALLWHIFQLPINFFSLRYVGDITYRMEMVRNVSRFVANMFTDGVLQSILILIYLTLLIFYDIPIAMIILSIGIVNIIIFYHIAKIKKEKSLLLSVDLGNYYAHCFSGFRIIESIKASGAEQDIFTKIIGSQVKVSNAIHESSEKTMLMSILPTVMNILASILVLAIGSIKVMNGEMTIGTLVAIQSIALSFINPLMNLINLSGQIQGMAGTIAKLDDVLENQIDQDENILEFTKYTNTKNVIKLKGLLNLANVTFGFNVLEPPILKNISFTIYPGTHIAIVGRSGSGKSTLAKLIAHLYKSWQGEIFFDNEPISKINKITLANSLSLIEQDSMLFTGSIKENITIWDQSIDDRQIIQAAKDACIHEEISSRSYDYDTKIDPFGNNFSGGERQRIEIARALVNNPSILILDEATSELDPILENQIHDNIRKKGCTTIIITHRITTAQNADKIIVLEHGEIVQAGTHQELSQMNGEYQRLLKDYE